MTLLVVGQTETLALRDQGALFYFKQLLFQPGNGTPDYLDASDDSGKKDDKDDGDVRECDNFWEYASLCLEEAFEDDDGHEGCAMSATPDGPVDPLLPFLALLAFAYLARRRVMQ